MFASKRNVIVAAATLTVAVIGTTTMALTDVHHDPKPVAVQPVNDPGLPANWSVADLSETDKSYILANLLPYHRVDAPKWCAEDMACWIGSNADGRTDGQIFGALREDLVSASKDYLPTTWHPHPVGDVIVCPGGVIEADDFAKGNPMMVAGGWQAHCA